MKTSSLLLTLLAVTLAGCGPSLPERPEDRPATLIFAVEGLSWDLLLPAMRAGRAPHLLDLARRGSAARLSTLEPTRSPMVWTSIATGKNMEKHDMARSAWNILGEAGHSVGVVGWPVTWPPEPALGGVTEFRRHLGDDSRSAYLHRAYCEEQG